MNFKKILVVFVAVAFMCVPAFAGDQPEFDTVGDDSLNFFNDAIKAMVIDNNIAADDTPINLASDFTECFDCDLDEDDDFTAWEFFDQTAGSLYEDPCFNRIPGPNGEVYKSALVDAGNSAEYEWQIVLQKKPQADIILNIMDCVLKRNSFDPFGSTPGAGAEQTGRYTMPWGEIFFIKSANPSVTVTALPGCYATNNFPEDGFFMDARTTPKLRIVALEESLYTSLGVWNDAIVMVMPNTGVTNKSGQTMYRLKQGDRLKVEVKIPGNNSVDVRYGPDNVILEYIAVHGTEFMNTDPCCCDEPEDNG